MSRRTEHDGAEREPYCCGDQRKQRAFGDELLDDPPAAGAERDSNRDLVLAWMERASSKAAAFDVQMSNNTAGERRR